MSKKLVQSVETYRIDDESEVDAFLEELRNEMAFEIKKYSSTKKQKVKKGEIEDEWIQFTVTKAYY